MPLRLTRSQLVAAVGGVALLAGVGLAVSPLGGWLEARLGMAPTAMESGAIAIPENSPLLPLLTQGAGDRQAALTQLAETASGLDRHRARYLLAADAIAANRGTDALPWLENLETDYPVLAPQILVLRAQAQTQAGQGDRAIATWQTLLEQHPTDPAAAEAHYALGRQDGSHWERMIAANDAQAGPNPLQRHPRTVQLAKELLDKNPQRPDLLSLIVRHAPDDPNVGTYLVRLEKGFTQQVTPEDWQAIALVYWRKWQYENAAKAYAKAPPTPLHRFRTGRGFQLAGKRPEAIAAYRTLIQAFPEAPETGTALVNLAALLPPTEAIAPLDQAIARFPDEAPRALLRKATILDGLNSAASASQVRQTLLSQHPATEAAAELRWSLAEAAAKAKNLAEAQNQAAAIAQNAIQTDLGPRATYWAGKWATANGQGETAQTLYRQLLRDRPGTYYAWRAATQLGLPVGDFTTVRSLQPEVIPPTARDRLPAGSEILQELYLLHQDRAAWERWQVELVNKAEPTVAEQFTDGLMRLGVGDNLQGIFMLSNLAWRKDPRDRAAFDELQQRDAYWQALYPFPYQDLVVKWSTQRNLNPMLVTALMRQESRFEREIVSVAGAVGLMQVMPATGKWVAPQAGIATYDLNNPDDNIALGTWFLDYTHREYDGNSMFAIASYNAGPGNVSQWIRRFGTADLDAFVEAIPFGETRGYVESVFENYWNYLRLYNPETTRLLNGDGR
ncbi:MAG: transglycosylase SLT domain-containing protein [Cyanophyceae cyanobacterium]